MFICNAGYNVASVLPDGTVNHCLNKKISLGNIYTGFKFKNDLVACESVFCDCPLYSFEKNLHNKALGKKFKEQDYSAFIHWHVTYSCNMRCHYCIVCAGDPEQDMKNKLAPADSIKVPEMIRSLDEAGHKFLISFIGGEPFLVPNMNYTASELTKAGHKIMYNTNFTKITPEFFDVVDMKKLGCFHISCHIIPMERRGLTKRFIRNVNYMQSTGHTDYYITVVAEPDIFLKLDYYKEKFAKHDIYFKLIPMLDGGGVDGKVYPESYTDEQLEQIDKDWLREYFPEKFKNKEEAIMTDYTFPVLNTDKRG